MSSAFFTVHRDLDREGPGEAADVHWALDVAGTPEDARILDAACGPGADMVTLAKAWRRLGIGCGRLKGRIWNWTALLI